MDQPSEPASWTAVAHHINARVKQLGWSQAELVRASGVSAPKIRQIQNDELDGVAVRAPTMWKIEDALGWARGSIADCLATGAEPRLATPAAMTAEQFAAQVVASLYGTSADPADHLDLFRDALALAERELRTRGEPPPPPPGSR